MALYGMMEWDMDAREILRIRLKMKAQLARYLHLGSTDQHLGWGDMDARELRLLYDEMVEILKGEKTPTTE